MRKGSKMTDEQRARLSEAHKGKSMTEANRLALRAAHLGRKNSPETIAKMKAAAANRVITPEHRAKIAAARRGKPGRKLSDAEKEHLRAVHTGMKASPATLAKMSVARKGTVASPETCRKMSIAQLGHEVSPKTREKLRQARLGKPALHRKGSLYRFEYEGYKMRSTWEVEFAKTLDRAGIDWQYEPVRFNLGNHTYTPDFYLPELDVYYEIKGWLTEEAQRKIALFRLLYPEQSLIVATGRVMDIFRMCYPKPRSDLRQTFPGTLS